MFNNQSYNQNDFGYGLGNGQNQQNQQQQQFQNQGFPQQNMGGYNGDMNNQFNQGGYQQQNMMGGQPNGGMMGGAFPGQQQPMDMGMGAPAQQQQTTAAATPGGFDKAKLAKGGFNKNVSEFVPKGKVVMTAEQFPDLDAMDEPAPKKKKNKKKAAPKPAPVEEEVIDETTQWKGKPSTFFVMTQNPNLNDPANPMGFEMNDDQWNFVFRFYPEYAGAPFDMMTWLFGQAKANEDAIEAANAQYMKPKIGGRKAGEEDDDDTLMDSKYDRGFSGAGKKQNKKNTRSTADEEAEAKLRALKELKSKVQPGKTEAEKQEVKALKAFKDKDVNMNPEGCKDVDTTREPCSMVFIGHVDAGKSTICGNLMYLMGVVDVRTIEKYKQEAKDKGRDSWWLAYVMDVSDDEKAKGKTVEVGRAQFDTPTKKYTIFDAPGHKNYVPNMIMGAAMADVGGLVISARKGEFEAGFEKDGQTREHAQLAKSLGVQKLVIIVNKMDDSKWAKKRYDEIQTGLLPFLKKTGYTEDDLVWIPISGLSGDNIEKNVATSICNWYKGPTLIELLDKVNLEKRFPTGPLRIPILDKMKDKDLIVHGKVENGTINLGDKLALMPSGAPAQVMSLLDGKGDIVKFATPGENVQIKLNVADEDAVQRGCVLSNRDQMMPVTDVFEAELDILELLDYKPIISKGYTCIMHIHTFNDEIIIKDLVKLSFTDPSGKKVDKVKPQFAKSQQKLICRITPKNPVALEKFDSIQQMGRFTLRDEGKTIAVGKVLKYKPYIKGVVGQNIVSNANANAVAKQLEQASINEPAKEELVYDMDTGEMKPKAKELAGIAEGDEDEN